MAFTVGNVGTAFQIAGGSGQDTIIATGLLKDAIIAEEGEAGRFRAARFMLLIRRRALCSAPCLSNA